jgi:CBS domain-containing protein/anti-sigma regulatory factor (Ser/Thr protein kinase)
MKGPRAVPSARITKTQEMVYEMKVGEVMTRTVFTVRPDDPISRLRGILRQNRISGLPVVDQDRLVGLISLEDFIKWLGDRAEDGPIRNRMTRELETVHDDDSLVMAIGKFERSGLGRLPVVARHDPARLVGILTKGDVIEGLLKKLEIDYQEEQVRRHQTDHVFFEDVEADRTALVLQYDVKGQDFGQAGESSSRLKKTLQRLGLRPDLARRVAIASYEAEMNVVVFTPGGTLRAKVQPNIVQLEAEDSGPGIRDIAKAMEPGYSTAPDWVRELGFGAGMGLPNIQKSCDRFEIDSQWGKGTHLTASFFVDAMADDTG